ncbi:hypothetical protein PPTG_04596 [Phytophthora nicotianae INRA-310]|uniref:Uncharacterized protein n=2 Tax=Phytophthora nicotianae TaxID=4792 RepID=W2R1R3_PHYN3|nr:hypothetical protein PPTG_04596 [Phytophthora nicotianae INRA-310]ETN19221.1 hypothetical protein PPTG_04596 [Phytophthora nicotianae INRA-310]
MSLRAGSGHFPSISFLIRESQLALHHKALRNTKNTSNAKDHIKLMHVDHPLAILAETSATDKSKADAETTAQAVLDLTHTSKKVATTTAPTGTTSTEVDLALRTPSKRFFRADEKTVNVLTSKFLLS